MKSLQPLSEFVLNQSKKYWDGHITLAEYQNSTQRYATFLNQPLTLGMFTPCDDKGKPIEEPKKETESYKMLLRAAERRVLFPGFALLGSNDKGTMAHVYHKEKNIVIGFGLPWERIKVIEDLSKLNIEVQNLENNL